MGKTSGSRRALWFGRTACVALAASFVCAAAAAQPPRPQADLTAAARAAAQLPRLHSLIVSWRGEIVLEHYKRGIRATQAANIKSASKSVISTLVGIALDRGLIKSLREPIATFFPQIRRDQESRKHAITIEDLLTMRSGLESTSGQNYGRWVNSGNWVSHALGRPLISEPGTTMQYSTGSSHLLSAILTKATGMSTWQFAQNTLAQPLKFALARWTRDPQGIYFGGNEMGMTPRQLIAYGELYLNRGQAHGKQVVPAAWVDTSCVPRTYSRFDAGREYGYGWWIDEYAGHQACFAWGFGGQYVFVFRDLRLVVVVTSDPTVSDERRGYRRELLAMIERDVVEAVAGVAGGL